MIGENEVDAEFQDAVLQLNELMDLASCMQSRGVKAASEVIIMGGSILKQANSKTFVHFTARLGAVGRDISSLGALQQSVFLRLKGLYEILKKYNENKATSFRKEYLLVAQQFYYQCYSDVVNRFALKKTVPLPPTPLVGDIRHSTSTLF